MKNEMNIICRTSSNKGYISFYLVTRNEEYFMFDQKYKSSAYNYYKNGIPVRKIFDYKGAHRDYGVENVIKRLRSQITYIEKEYGIYILNKTKCKKAA